MKVFKILVVGAAMTTGLGLTGSMNEAARAQVTQQGNAYLLRMKFTPGATMRYTINTSMTMGGGNKPMRMNIPTTMRVVSVKNGIATIETTTDMSGMSKDAPPQKTTMKMDSRGNVVGGTNSGQLTPAGYPQNAVRVGQTWKQAFNTGGMKLDATYTFRGIRNAGNRRVADLAISMKGGQAQQQMSGTGSMQINMADGMLIQTNMNMKIGTGAQAGNMTMTMKRVN